MSIYEKNRRPFLVQRPAFFSMRQLERIEEAAMRILEEVGIAVLDDGVLEQLSSCGFAVKDKRILIERKLIQEFLEAERERNGNSFSEEPQPVEISSSRITLSLLTYPQHVHDIETDEIVPFTTERLIEATKLVDVLSSRGPIIESSRMPYGCPAAASAVSAILGRCGILQTRPTTH